MLPFHEKYLSHRYNFSMPVRTRTTLLLYLKMNFLLGQMDNGSQMVLLFMVVHPASPGSRLLIIISAVIKAKQQRQSAASWFIQGAETSVCLSLKSR